jgi:hypothetical protein
MSRRSKRVASKQRENPVAIAGFAEELLGRIGNAR